MLTHSLIEEKKERKVKGRKKINRKTGEKKNREKLGRKNYKNRDGII